MNKYFWLVALTPLVVMACSNGNGGKGEQAISPDAGNGQEQPLVDSGSGQQQSQVENPRPHGSSSNQLKQRSRHPSPI